MKALATFNSPVPDQTPYLKNPNTQFLTEVKDEIRNYGHLYDETIPEVQKEHLPKIIFKNWRQISARGGTNKNKRKVLERIKEAKKQEYGSRFKENGGVVKVWM